MEHCPPPVDVLHRSTPLLRRQLSHHTHGHTRLPPSAQPAPYHPSPPLPPSHIYPYPSSLSDLPSARGIPAPSHLSHSHSSHSHPHPTLSQPPAVTCIPSLIPPGMDPTQVDMRTFYPYTPNEVKHRKRTTRTQLKVLEDVYKRDTKPNAPLRKRLASELQMTPRGVQVWFQNRRAKSKMQEKKAASLRSTSSSTPTARKSSTSPSPSPIMSSPTLSFDTDFATNAHAPQRDSDGGQTEQGFARDRHARDTSDMGSSGSSDTATYECDPPTPQPTSPPEGESAPTPKSDRLSAMTLPARQHARPQPSRSGSIPVVAVSFHSPFGAEPTPSTATASSHAAESVLASLYIPPHPSHQHTQNQGQGTYSHLAPPAHDLLALRRPSLPILPMAPSSPSPSPYPYYGAHAYGQGNTYGSASNGMGAYDSPVRRASIAVPDPHALKLSMHPFAHLAAAANLHQGPEPSQSQPRGRVASEGGEGYELSAPEAVSPRGQPSVNIAVRTYGLLAQQQQQQGGGAYVVSTRQMVTPIPGPLPTPDFSFGAPASSPVASASANPNPNSNLNATHAGYDAYEGYEAGVYDGAHRGSISSEAETEDSEYDRGVLSRFGSIASVGGGSESSWTSYYESEEGCGVKEAAGGMSEDRRGSCASGHFVEMFSGISVSNGSQSRSPSHPYLHSFSQSSPSLLAHARDGSRPNGDSADGNDMAVYESAAVDRNSGSPPNVQRSSSSELAHALSHGGCGNRESVDANMVLPSGFEYADSPPMESSSSIDVSGHYSYQHAHDAMSKGTYSSGYDVPTYAEAYSMEQYGYVGMSHDPNPFYSGGVELTQRHMCVPESEGLRFMGFGTYGSPGYP